MRLEFLVPAAIIIVLILLWFFSAEDISGVWVAPDDFAKSAEVDSMMLVLENSGFSKYNGYLHMPQYIGELELHGRFGGRRGATHVINAKTKFSEAPTFPEDVKIEYNLAEGRMVIYDDSTTYAVFFKDNELTYNAVALR